MITYLNTSIFDLPAIALVNPVNTVGVMGKGLALEFRRRWPAMYPLYQQRCQMGFEIGTLQVYYDVGRTIINFPTKKNWRGLSRITYIEAGLQRFVDSIDLHNIESVAFPHIGCGLGGLEWERHVHPLMVRYLDDLKIPVYIHGEGTDG